SWQLPESYHEQNRKEFLFFAGNLEPRKNLVCLVRALKELQERDGLTVPLHLAGPAGWKNHTLLSMIANSPIKESIHHLGFISEEELKREYLTCKALVYPSLYEGFGMPVLEALSLDCMVLTSKNTVMQEICGDAALYFDPYDPVDCAGRIQELYRPNFDRTSILCHRKKVLDQFDWKHSAEVMRSEMTGTGL
ncbi:MAG: glycosyltransferase family 4 protein, partial [Chitinispirillaceae bacterium]|nr:glycosyltransferase family 4 protein [Chitinispirillaceae bacterium]